MDSRTILAIWLSIAHCCHVSYTGQELVYHDAERSQSPNAMFSPKAASVVPARKYSDNGFPL